MLYGPQPISTGELVALVRGLPAGGAVAHAEGAWADDTELLASMIEHLDAIARLLYGQSGKRAPWPAMHVPRPGEQPAPAVRTPDRMRELLHRVGGDA